MQSQKVEAGYQIGQVSQGVMQRISGKNVVPSETVTLIGEAELLKPHETFAECSNKHPSPFKGGSLLIRTAVDI